MSEVKLNQEGLRYLKNALGKFSQFVIGASDDFSFEEGIIADTPDGVVIQFLAGDIDGGEQTLQIRNLSENSISYVSPKRGNKYTRAWQEVGLRGDQKALLPFFQDVIKGLMRVGILVDRLEWNMSAAYTGKLNLVKTKKIKNGNYVLILRDKDAWGEGE